MTDKKLVTLLVALSFAIPLDIRRGRELAGHVVEEIAVLPDNRFPDLTDIYAYVQWSYGYGEAPDWA
jgi:hypothetical protein